MNGLKNFFGLCINSVATGYFILNKGAVSARGPRRSAGTCTVALLQWIARSCGAGTICWS